MNRPVQPIESLDDPRVAAYRNLKDRDLAREGDRFIAEGEQVVKRLLASDYPVESVLLSERRTEEIAPIVAGSIPVYVLSDALMHQVMGFKFHSGVIACGRRRARVGLDEQMSRLAKRATIMILPEVANTENLGLLLRIAAGFGVDVLLLGPQCCNPFYRQSVRVSMGTVFSLNIVQSEDLIGDLRRLRSQWGVELVAAVLEPGAQPLHEARRGDRLGLLFGNEAQGLSQQMLEECDRRVTIPMKLGTDSLNVAVAAAVFLFHFGNEQAASTP